MLPPGMRTSSIFNTEHVTTCCNRVAKRAQHVAPNNVAIVWSKLANAGPAMLGYVVLKCGDRLAGPLGCRSLTLISVFFI